MDIPEIEKLINTAITSRPTVTNAALNLYVHKGRLVCGARSVMPLESDFVAHVTGEDITNGFNDLQWRSIVNRVQEISNAYYMEDDSESAGDSDEYDEKRTEPRLNYHRPMYFSDEINSQQYTGNMLDISSGGIAFSARTKNTPFHKGQNIVTRFTAPRFNADNSFETVSFNRTGRICRVSPTKKVTQIAVQFATPLPFKPADQNTEDAVSKQVYHITA